MRGGGGANWQSATVRCALEWRPDVADALEVSVYRGAPGAAEALAEAARAAGAARAAAAEAGGGSAAKAAAAAAAGGGGRSV